MLFITGSVLLALLIAGSSALRSAAAAPPAPETYATAGGASALSASAQATAPEASAAPVQQTAAIKPSIRGGRFDEDGEDD